MTDILTFNNPEFGSIRSIEQNGEPWFVGKDVARSLGYGDGKSLANAVANHVDEQDKGVTELMTPLWHSETGHHQRERPLQPDLQQQAGRCAAVQALGHQRGAAQHPQDWVLRHP